MSVIKSTVVYSERSSILATSEKHPPCKVFDYSVKIYFARYHTPLINFMDNPPTHNEREKHTLPCLFSHNKGMNTMICVLQPPFPPLLSSTRPQVYSKVRLPRWTCLIWTRYLMYRAHACVCMQSKLVPRLRLTHMLHCWVRSCLRVTRYKIDLWKLPLTKFAEVIVARQAALQVHYLNP